MGQPVGRLDFGPATPMALNELMFALLVRAVMVAQELTPRETTGRMKYSDHKPGGEVVTPGDRKLQRFIVRHLRGYLDGVGIIAEEPKTGQSDLRISCTMKNGRRLYFTVDPLDGTKMITLGIRRFVGIMVSLVEIDDDGYLTVLGSWVANVYTGEIFTAPVESNKSYRTYRDRTTVMTPRAAVSWDKARLVINCDPAACPDLIRPLVKEVVAGGVIERLTAHGGSGGLMLIEELVGGEAQAVVINPLNETPWDMAPSRLFLSRGGYVLLRVVDEVLVPADLRLKETVVPIGTFGIWTHSAAVPSLRRLLYR
jgi:fructose-1,6-bisphosphatase/inositol monophosphatase family enzyme